MVWKDGSGYNDGLGRLVQDTRIRLGSIVQDTWMDREGWFRIQGWIGKDSSGNKDGLGRMVQETRMGWEGWFRIQGWVGKDGLGYKDGLERKG